jgi:hypothetical protein
MSLPGSPTLELDVGPRRTERRVALLAISFAAAAPWLAGADWTMALLGALGAGICWRGFQQAGWLGGERRISRVSWQAEGRWLLTDHGGRQFEVWLRPDSRVAAGLVWLRWDTGATHTLRTEQGARSMLLTLGDIPGSQLRRLCVRLRLDGSQSCVRPPYE